MSDDHITESPTPPRCPVCATGFATTPGTSCPACGRVFALLTPREAEIRLTPERFRLDGPAWFTLGLVLLFGVSYIAFHAAGPGIIIPLIILLVPALIRTIRLFRGRENDPAIFWFASFIAALGVSILMAVAAGAACFGVCLVIASGPGIGMLTEGFVGGGITGVIVFVALYVIFWPRYRTSSRHDHGED